MNWLLLKLKIASNGMRYAWRDGHVRWGIILCSLAIIIEAIVRSSLIGVVMLAILALIGICFEIINTYVEKVCDTFHSQYNMKIKEIKDTLTVAPVLSYSIFAIVWVVLLCVPYLP
jgi:diacylglycerol kinase